MNSIFPRNINEVTHNGTKSLKVGNFEIYSACHMSSLHFSETSGWTVMTRKASGIMYSLAMYYLLFFKASL